MNHENMLGIFLDESRDNLQLFSDKLLELENEPDDNEILNEIFRVAHTIKGMAKTMGFNGMSDITHNLENLLELLRSGKKRVNGHITDVLFDGLDKLELLVASIVETGDEKEIPGVRELVKNIEKLTLDEPVEEPEEQDESPITNFTSYETLVVREAFEKGLQPKEITVYIENECVMPGARCYMVNSVLETYGEIFKTIPTVEEMEKSIFLTEGNYKHVVKFCIVTKEYNEDIRDKLFAISEIERIEIVDITDIPEVTEPLPGATQEIQEKPEKKEKTEEIKQDQPKQTGKLSSHTIRVNAERLDNLVNLVGELVINKTRISQLSREINDAQLSEVTASIENITSEVQEIVMKLRMVQIEQVFSRFPRLVRDITRQMNKDINFEIKGQDIEIDRAIVDEIAEPLIHLLRNSLDHGLETKEDRIKAGKKAKGTLQLLAVNECDNILIKVIDDGRGIDPEKILKKAIEKGLTTKEEADKLSTSEIMEFLFRPGFSTAETINELSGRGVGMDVVKTKIAELNGTVGIKSEKGAGSTVTITLPSTMAIIQSMLVGIGDEIYAIPLNYINEVIDIPLNQIKFIQNREVINFRGSVIPIKRLDQMLNVPMDPANNSGSLTLILMQSEDHLVGISVSRVINQQEVVIKNINKNLSAKDYISGVTTLGNGRVAFILNVNTLIK